MSRPAIGGLESTMGQRLLVGKFCYAPVQPWLTSMLILKTMQEVC